MKIVAPILPAVADTSGSGGLIAELSNNRVSPRVAYTLLVAIGLLLTWSLNIFEIISYASRAFALYYSLQSGIAALSARRAGDSRRAALYGPLALLGLAIAVLGKPFE